MQESIQEYSLSAQLYNAPNASGWDWCAVPCATGGSTIWFHGTLGKVPPIPVVMMAQADIGGAVMVHLAYSNGIFEEDYECRIVVFDDNGERYPLKKGIGGSVGKNMLTIYRFGGDTDNYAPKYDSIRYVGVEVKRVEE
jgi:hypothetical protein